MKAPDRFELVDEELALQEAVRKALSGVSPHRALTTEGADLADISRRHWSLAQELGWPGLMVAEAAGGSGLGRRDMTILAEEMGAQLFCGPFLPTAVLATALAELARLQGRMMAVASDIASGRMTVALGASMPTGGVVAAQSSLRMLAESRPTLWGERDIVEYPGTATHVLALDLVAAGEGAVEILAALAPTGPGVTLTPRQPFDLTCPIAHGAFDRAVVPDDLWFRAILSSRQLEELFAPVHLAVAADLVGTAQAAFDRAVEHAKNRRQFGAPIGGFQSIKHRLADGFVAVRHARLALRHAADAGDDVSAIQAARILAGAAALKVTGDAIQVLGGLGFSWESDAHLYLKRARRLVAQFGGMAAHRQAVASQFISSVLAIPECARD